MKIESVYLSSTANSQIPAGYKLTEAGLIPADWVTNTLDRIAFVTSGKRLPLGSSLTEQETPHPYIRVTDMRPGTVKLSDIKFVPVEVFPAIKRYRIFKEDIFISVAGTLGIVGKIPLELEGANLTENANRVTSISCSQNYLLHVLMSPMIQNTIESEQTVGAQPKLALTRIRKFLINLPPTKAEQEAIANALSDADALIEYLEQLITKKRQIKQGTMQELLTGKKRLPGFRGEWVNKAIGDIAPLQRGFDLPNPKIQTGSYPVVYSNGILNFHAEFQVKGPGVVTGRSGTIGSVTFVEQNFWPHNTSLWVTSFKSNDPKFIYYLYTRIGLERFATGSGVPTLNRNDVHAFKVLIPTTNEEQAAIANFLSDMDTEITELETKLTKARAVKQGMMRQLLTGRIRLI